MTNKYNNSNHKPQTNPIELIRSIYANRGLIVTLSKREISGRYKGSYFGILWSLLTPLIMLTIYTLVFSEIFKVKWNPIESAANEKKIQFALIIFSGMIIFNFFSEIISRSTSIIRLHTNYVKKVIFPLEILPIILICDAGFHALISFSILIIGIITTGTLEPLKILLLPLFLFPYVILCLGISFFISSIAVYIRDSGQAVSLLITALMFLSPIFYPLSAVPKKFNNLIALNPITYVIEKIRGDLFFNYSHDIYSLITYYLASILVLIVGFHFFQKTRLGFADVL